MKKWMISLVVIIVLFGAGFYVWENVNIGLNKQELLLKRFNQFSSMISVNLCQEAYDQFITANSKQIKGDNFFDHCKYRNEDWSNIKIENIVFSGNNRADIKYSFDLSTPDLDSKQFNDCEKVLDFSLCQESAPKKLVKRESIETWLYQKNKWMRDY